MTDRELLFYDIECFRYDSLVIFKNIYNKVVRYWWSTQYPEDLPTEDLSNGFDGLKDFVTGKTLVGYNNYNYDDIMLTEMMNNRPQKYIYAMNNTIIRGGSRAFKPDPVIHSLDCFQQIDVSNPSLKRVEGNMGKSIIESSVDFTIQRPLTEQEREEVFQYCAYDIENTIEIYKLRTHSYFEPKQELLGMVDTKSASAYRWNTTTLSAQALMDRPQPRWDRLRIPAHLWRNPALGIDGDVWDMWSKVNEDSLVKDTSQTKICLSHPVEFTFGFGGLHGVAVDGKRFKNVKLLDVGSMYPTIIIFLMALGTATAKYDGIRKHRLEVKHKDKILSDALKLILNSVYGNLKNQYSILFNPMASATVCIYGQIALFDLCRRLDDAGYTVVNANTDGVAFCGMGTGYEEIWHQWEKDYDPMRLELDVFDTWIQKDVNNYIATKGEKVKVKGGDTNKYLQDQFFKNNSLRIVQMAMVDKLLYDTDPIVTVSKHLDHPEWYQTIIQAGRTYQGVYDMAGKKYQNVNRVFACKPEYAEPRLFKKRLDGGLVNFPRLPENMMVWNGATSDFKDFAQKVDLKYYKNEVYEKLKGWM